MKYLFLPVILLLITSCCEKKPKLGGAVEEYASFDMYYSSISNTKYSNAKIIDFEFSNNPFDLNANNTINIYINNSLVYNGAYCKKIELRGDLDSILDERQTFNLILEILTDKNEKSISLHRYSSKFGQFIWNEKYKIIYCAFLPTNESVEQIYFYPQLHPFQ